MGGGFMRQVSYIVYAVFKNSDYKLGSFKTYRAARENVEAVSKENVFMDGHQGFMITERASTYKKVYDSRESSSPSDSRESIYNTKE